MTKQQEFRKQTEEAKLEAFSLMCKKVAELEKENADLKRDKEDLIFVRNAKADHIIELKEQIEKMKCCQNCKHLNSLAYGEFSCDLCCWFYDSKFEVDVCQ